MTVSKPLGESAAYDFVVESRGKLSRVQVRSVAVERAGTYRVSAAKGGGEKRGYTEDEIDVLAAYVIPCETWYLIPVRAFAPVKSIHLCPHKKSRRTFEKWRERWDVFESTGRSGVVADIQACLGSDPALDPSSYDILKRRAVAEWGNGVRFGSTGGVASAHAQ